MLRLPAVVLSLFILLVASLSAAETIDPQFVRHPKIQSVTLSPEGDKLAIVMIDQGERVLTVMTLDPLEITYVLRFTGDEEVHNAYWVNNERIVTSLRFRIGWLDQPRVAPNLYALNYDGRSQKNVFGYHVGHGQNEMDSRIQRQEIQYASAEVIHPLPNDRKHMLVRSMPWKRQGYNYFYDETAYGEILKLNVYNGRTRTVMPSPVRGGTVFANDDGEITFARGIDGHGMLALHKYHNEEWQRIGNAQQDQEVTPFAYDKTGTTAYLLSRVDTDKTVVKAMDLATGKQSLVFADDDVDVQAVTVVAQAPLAVLTENGLPQWHTLDSTHPVQGFLRGFAKSFPGYRVFLESLSENQEIAVLSVSGDNLPRDFFLANLKENSAEFLLSAADWLQPDDLARTEAFSTESRDGSPLRGYLTFPRNSSRENLPMVVIPHGGPQTRDYWTYDGEAQLLAQKGYLVLKVNFRGSDGYGHQFQRASDRHWGDLVQNDIADAVRWAISAGYVDPRRICIYGASFGAYSAMMNAIREPGLYRCAAGFAGVYDLPLMYGAGDIPGDRRGEAYLERVIGRDQQQLHEFSPVHNVEAITVPVFLAHGGRDERAPIEHAYRLEKALKENGAKVTTLYYPAGEHGYYEESANLALYSALMEFLDTHIGVEAQPAQQHSAE